MPGAFLGDFEFENVSFVDRDKEGGVPWHE